MCRNAAAGAAGGLIAAFAMNQFQALLSSLQKKKPQGGDDATVKTANAISRSLTGHAVDPSRKKRAGAAVHYTYGMVIGAVYGALAGAVPVVASRRGMAYGAAAWLGGDEVSVPALGLGPSPMETPVAAHLQALASHLVYGAVTDGVFRLLTSVP